MALQGNIRRNWI